ncbi:MAG: BON domain-containing protein [Pseudomonadota bacterium]
MNTFFNILKNNKLLLLVAFILVLQTGCAAFVVGAGTAAAVATDKRTAGDMLEDENIELKFIHRFYQDKQLSETSHVNATSYNGWLLLTGEAPNPAIKQALYNQAINIKNVKRIFNEISISAPSSIAIRSSDTYLTSKIKISLLANKKTEAYHVKVITENSIVYLMGLITQEQSVEVVKVIQEISGVQRIIKLFDYSDQ